MLILITAFVPLRYIYDHDVKNGCFRILLFSSLPLMHVPLAEIRDVREVALKEGWRRRSFALKLGNRIRGDYVIIERKRGILRTLIVTPDNPGEFVKLLQQSKRETTIRD